MPQRHAGSPAARGTAVTELLEQRLAHLAQQRDSARLRIVFMGGAAPATLCVPGSVMYGSPDQRRGGASRTVWLLLRPAEKLQ